MTKYQVHFRKNGSKFLIQYNAHQFGVVCVAFKNAVALLFYFGHSDILNLNLVRKIGNFRLLMTK